MLKEAALHASLYSYTTYWQASIQGCIVFARGTHQLTGADLQAPTHPNVGLQKVALLP